MITPGQATAILNTKYQDRNGQWRKLGNFSEFAGLEQRANDAANKAWNFESAQKRREGRAIIQSVRDQGVLLNEQEAKALEARLAPLNINRYEYADLLETKDDRLTEKATELFDQVQRDNTYFPDGAMRHLPDARTVKAARQHNANLRGGFLEMTKNQKENVTEWIKARAAFVTQSSVLNPPEAAIDARADLEEAGDNGGQIIELTIRMFRMLL